MWNACSGTSRARFARSCGLRKRSKDCPYWQEHCRLQSGVLSWCAVRELARVAVLENEPAWLAAARGKTLRQLEELVAGKSPGDAPDAQYRPEARRHDGAL